MQRRPCTRMICFLIHIRKGGRRKKRRTIGQAAYARLVEKQEPPGEGGLNERLAVNKIKILLTAEEAERCFRSLWEHPRNLWHLPGRFFCFCVYFCYYELYYGRAAHPA